MLRVDAFTTKKGQGNPAGVVLDGDKYTSEQMQKIAYKVGFNETVFICTSQSETIKLRYFTPGHETPLFCYTTISSFCSLYHIEDAKNYYRNTCRKLTYLL